ncbi:pro-FMRFamide-related neuropeptide FF like isoform X2 [Phycodurus eques]|uniref:pro-FMRFamide-related neuropeptide FF like isoform X2 n=1 Tax=Phycodurus eques TaxID=693459 RepID=UPI002ACE11AF|nr:pro-FMRFamide-related neuropeptide FF like isoform X2 [Phycodurus eques]
MASRPASIPSLAPISTVVSFSSSPEGRQRFGTWCIKDTRPGQYLSSCTKEEARHLLVLQSFWKVFFFLPWLTNMDTGAAVTILVLLITLAGVSHGIHIGGASEDREDTAPGSSEDNMDNHLLEMESVKVDSSVDNRLLTALLRALLLGSRREVRNSVLHQPQRLELIIGISMGEKKELRYDCLALRARSRNKNVAQ